MKTLKFICTVIMLGLIAVSFIGCELPYSDDSNQASGITTIRGTVVEVAGGPSEILLGAIQKVVVYIDDYEQMTTVELGEAFLINGVTDGNHYLHLLNRDTEGVIDFVVKGQKEITFANIRMNNDRLLYEQIDTVVGGNAQHSDDDEESKKPVESEPIIVDTLKDIKSTEEPQEIPIFIHYAPQEGNVYHLEDEPEERGIMIYRPEGGQVYAI